MQTSPHTPSKKYWAFISYSSKDQKWGQWLHRRLENYPIPKEFQGTELFDGSVLGKNLRPVFRDRDELSGSSDLGPAILSALKESRYLIVLCSKNSAQSEWVNKEIEDFRAIGGSKNILALILDGEPNATSNSNISDTEECFPPSLRYPHEPLAGDLRKEGDGKERGFLKLLAGISQIGFDDLYRRHERLQRRKRLVLVSLASIIIATLTSLLFYALNQQQKAQRSAVNEEKQRIRAQQNEEKAISERNNAQNSLVKLYFDRAQGAESAPESLAWMLKAAETRPECLTQPALASHLQSWMGPWPCPEKVMRTGIARNLNNNQPLISRKHRRILVRENPEAWRLLSWSSETPISTGVIDDYGDINQMIDSKGGDWFAIRGQKLIEIREWSTGNLLFSEIASGISAQIVSLKGGIIVTSKEHNGPPLIYELRQTKEGFSRHDIVPLKGAIGSVTIHEEGSESNLAFIEEIERPDGSKKRFLRHLRRSSKKNPWRVLTVQLPEEAKILWLNSHENFPSHLVTLRAPNNELDHLYNLRTQDVTTLDHKDFNFIGVRNTSTGRELLARDFNSGTRETHIYSQPLGANNPLPLFQGRAIDRTSSPSKEGTLIGWIAEQDILLIDQIGKELLEIPLPRAPDFTHLRITEIHSLPNEQILLETGYSLSAILLINYSNPNSIKTWASGISKFRGILEINDSKFIKDALILSHGNQCISQAKLIPYADLIDSDKAIHRKFNGPVSWISSGQSPTSALIQTAQNSRKFVLQELNSSATTPLSISQNLKKVDEFSTGEIVIPSYETSILISKELADPKEFKSRSSIIIEDEGLKALSVEEGLIQSFDLISKLPLWSEPIEGNLIEFSKIPNSKHALALFEKRSNFYSSEEPPTIRYTLLKLDPQDGIIAQSELLQTGDQLLNRNYNDSVRIFPGNTPILIQKTTTGTSGSQYKLWEASTDSFTEKLEWHHHGESRIENWWPLNSSSLIALTSHVGSWERSLTHFSRDNEHWTHSEIRLPSAFKSIYPAPHGKKAIILCESHALLLDFENLKTSLTVLSFPQKKGYSYLLKAAWSPSGEHFFLWDEYAVQQFSEKGDYIREWPSYPRYHSNSQPDFELTAVTVSSDTQYLLMGDSHGNLTRQIINAPHITLRDLKKRTTLLGGAVIDKNDTLVDWPQAIISSPDKVAPQSGASGLLKK